MKAIAEYFRDLASDDRYFGAEPPQPDADMLARIAQREIARRVEAHTDGHAVVLRAKDEENEPAPAPVVEADTPAPAPAPVVAPVVTPEPVVAETPAVEAEAPAPVVEDVVEDTVAEAPVEEPAQDEVVAEDPAPEQPEEIEVAEVPAEAPQVFTPAEDAIEDAEDAPASLAPAVDSIAAKLQRIRDVVARGDTAEDAEQIEDAVELPDEAPEVDAPVVEAPVVAEEAQPVDEDAEDEALLDAIADAAAPVGDDTEDVIADAVADQVVAEGQHDTAEEDAPQVENSVLDTLAAALAEPVADAEEDASVAEDAVDADEVDEPQIDSVLDTVAEAVSEQDAAFEEEASQDTAPFDLAAFEAVAEAAQQDAPDDDDDDLGSEDAGEDTIFAGLDDADAELDAPEEDATGDDIRNLLAAETEEAAPAADPQVRGRVIKVKRADLEAAIQQGALEEIEEEEEAAQPVAPTDDSSLSPEDEADLMRELAEVEAELSEPAQTEPDADMPRLLAEAGQKMEEEESAANRETYAQLRAAVAATKAEVQVSGEPKLLALDEKYRNDLASVVRPDRPMTRPMTRPVTRPLAKTGDRSRPTTDIAAPLKLVAEQRVDGTDETPREPVRPRRVTTELLETEGAGASEEETSGFAVFAEKVGATGLSELLEAAAAYMSFVEGREKFSRPQLMTKVRQVERDDFNREDGLRSFGQLLREGKIQKVGGGRFAASPEIGFRPDQRAAG
ncbi:MAG: hypothetical protein AB3N23_13530 [Paracoccaceae bacterium]